MRYCGPRGIPYLEFVSRWDPVSQQAALDWSQLDASRCSGCGVPSDEADDFGAEIYICPGCEALESIDSKDAEKFRGVRKRLVPRVEDAQDG